MIKTTGIELKRFINDDEYWPDGSWYEFVEFFINGEPFEDAGIEDFLRDDDIVKMSGGEVTCRAGYLLDFERFFKAWRKKQSTDTFVIECDKSKTADIKAAVNSLGGKVIK